MANTRTYTQISYSLSWIPPISFGRNLVQLVITLFILQRTSNYGSAPLSLAAGRSTVVYSSNI